MRLWNPHAPQTLQGAAFLMYANVVVALLFGNVRAGGTLQLTIWGFYRGAAGGAIALDLARLLTLVIVVGSAFSGFFIVNERKIGWRVGAVVGLIPVVSGALCIVIGYPVRPGVLDVVDIGYLFALALVGCLFHSQTTDYVKVWFK